MKLTIKREERIGAMHSNTDWDTVTDVTVTATYEPGVDATLKPCPFCGGLNIDVLALGQPRHYACKCWACGATKGDQIPLPSSEGTADDTLRVVHSLFYARAIDAWNTRAK